MKPFFARLFASLFPVLFSRRASAKAGARESGGRKRGGAWRLILVALSIPLILAAAARADIVWQQTGGPEGGEVRALALDPRNPQVIYAGTTYGGVFKSGNGGRSWRNVLSGNTVKYGRYSIGSLAIDPSDSQTVYAAAYDVIYKSSDGGDSWIELPAPVAWNDLNALAVDPGGRIVYAATMAGLYKSTDAGNSWIKADIGVHQYGTVYDPRVDSVVIDPVDSQVIYASGRESDPQSNEVRVYKSADSGSTWVKWTYANGLPKGYGSSTSIVVDATNHQTVYVGTGGLGVYKSTNGGASWGPSAAGAGNAPGAFFMAFDAGSHALYSAALRSNDGGATWTSIAGSTGANTFCLAIVPGIGQTIYAGTSTGVMLTTNGGESWNPINSGLVATAVTSVVTDPADGQTLYAATLTGIFKSSDGGATWNPSNGWPWSPYSSSIALALDPRDSRILYAARMGGLYQSTDGGGSWRWMELTLPGESASISALAVDPGNGKTIYVGAEAWYGGYLVKTTDGGSSWKTVAGFEGSVASITVDPRDSQIVYVGTADGSFFKLTDGGNSHEYVLEWHDAPWKGGVYSIAIDPSNSQTLYLGTSGIFKSADGGHTWQQTLEHWVSSIAIDPGDPRRVFAAAGDGILASSDGGDSWNPANTMLSNTNLSTVVIEPKYRKTLYAASFGSGVFKGTMSQISGTPATSVVAGAPYSFTPIAAGATGFGISNKPAWAAFDSATGALTGTPSIADIGSYGDIVISASIGSATASLPAFTIKVIHPVLTLTGTPATTITSGSLYSFTPTASAAASFAISNKPSWASFNPDTGSLAGTPSDADSGVYGNIVISAANSGGRVYLAPFSITVTLKDGFLSQDVGSVGVVGSASAVDGVFTVNGSGRDIWGISDSFRYVYRIFHRDAEIVARVVSLQNTNPYAKSGVMFRIGLTPDSPQAMMALTPGNGAEFSRRTATGATTAVTAMPNITAPYWVKLVQKGGLVYGYVAQDGINWVLVGSDRIPEAEMSVHTYYGLAVTSHDNAALCTSAFDSVSTKWIPEYAAAQITSPVNGTRYHAPANLTFTVTGSPGIFANVGWVRFYAHPPVGSDPWLGDATTYPYRLNWNNVPAGNYTVEAWVVDTQMEMAQATVNIVVSQNPLPPPWATLDIGGGITLIGSGSIVNGVHTVTGSGDNIWGSADGFRYLYQPLIGDGEIVARVTSVQNTDGYAKGGVMIRETIDPGSAHATVNLTPLYGAEFSHRNTTGGSTEVSATAGVAAPYWVKLVRKGNTFSGYIAKDGAEWIPIGSATLSMGVRAYVGLIANSRNNSAFCTATMDGVSLKGGVLTLTPGVTLTAPAAASKFQAPAAITLSATATPDTGFVIKRVEFYADSTLLGTSTAAPYSFTWTNVRGGSYYNLMARAISSSGAIVNSTRASVMVEEAVLPGPWSASDIGSVGATGGAGFLNGLFTVYGAGADIGGAADGFRFVSQPMTGNSEIVARVASTGTCGPLAKAGVMIRQALTANSPYVMVDVTPAGSGQFSRRFSAGGTTTTTAVSGATPPYWVRVVRFGSKFIGYVSPDGSNWKLAGTASINMPALAYVGLAVTSHNNTVVCGATFDSVTTGVPTDASAPTITAFTTPASYASLTVPITSLIASDNVGVTGYLVNETPSAPSANAAGWSAVRPTSYTFASIGRKTLYAWAKDAAGGVSNPLTATVTVSGGALPAPWLTRDLGSVAVTGSGTYLKGTFMVKGAGSDIGGTADAFRFVYKPLIGNGQIVARVVALQNTDSSAKAGVMIRQSLMPGSPHATMELSAGNGAAFLSRPGTGAVTAATASGGGAAPYWVKLVRSGNTFTGSVSLDGVTWVPVGTSTISMPSTVYIGLAVTSHSTTPATASFDGVK